MKVIRRRRYSAAFKFKAVQQSIDSGETLAAIADKLGINPGLLSRWRRELTMRKKPKGEVRNQGPEKSLADLERENRRLKKRLERVELENEILKKANEYFDKLPK